MSEQQDTLASLITEARIALGEGGRPITYDKFATQMPEVYERALEERGEALDGPNPLDTLYARFYHRAASGGIPVTSKPLARCRPALAIAFSRILGRNVLSDFAVGTCWSKPPVRRSTLESALASHHAERTVWLMHMGDSGMGSLGFYSHPELLYALACFIARGGRVQIALDPSLMESEHLTEKQLRQKAQSWCSRLYLKLLFVLSIFPGEQDVLEQIDTTDQIREALRDTDHMVDTFIGVYRRCQVPIF